MLGWIALGVSLASLAISLGQAYRAEAATFKHWFNGRWPHHRLCLTRRCWRVQTYQHRCYKHQEFTESVWDWMAKNPGRQVFHEHPSKQPCTDWATCENASHYRLLEKK